MINMAYKIKHLSEEHKRKIAESTKGRVCPHKGKHLSEEHRKHISEANKGQIPWTAGKHHSQETIKKISESNKGKHHHSPEMRKLIGESGKGRKLSEAHIKILRETNKGRIRSIKTRKKMSMHHNPISNLNGGGGKKYFLDDGIFLSKNELKAAQLCKKHGLVKHFTFAINSNFPVKGGMIDIVLDDGTFLEIHYMSPLYNHPNDTLEDYYKHRRKLLDDNGFKDRPLLCFETAKEFEEWIKAKQQ